MKYITLILFIISFTSCDETTKTEKEPKVEQEYEEGIIYDAIVKNVIIGDFDGDGKEDELKETLISSINNKSIDALPQLEYDSLVTVIFNKKPILSLKSNSQSIPELKLTKKGSFGLFYTKNEGDLNQDGRDEISVIIDWADWSACNKCIIYTLKNGKWITYAKFDVREWQISRNPDFKGFINKNKNGIYEVSTFDSEVIEILKPLNELLVKHD
jgi:hypothetical protein